MNSQGFGQQRRQDHSQALARLLTRQLRDSQEEQDFDEERDREELDWESTGEVAEEDADPNDYLPGESTRPIDFTWQVSDPRLEDYFLARRPKAQWRVELTETGEPRVVRLSRRGLRAGTAGPPLSPVEYRSEILLVAAFEQLPYIYSGRIEDLQVLTSAQLIEAGQSRGPNPAVWERLQEGGTTIRVWLSRQFFYDPRGRLHAAGFLLQKNLWGLPKARVRTVLGELLAEEIAEGVFASDRELAAKLGRRLPGLSVTAAKIQRLPERASVWFPKRSERRKQYGQRP